MLQAIDLWHRNHPGQTYSIYDIAEALGVSYVQAFSSSNITSGFKACGIWPLNPNIFTDANFLSGYVTDRPAPPPPTESPSTELNLPGTSAADISSKQSPVTPEDICPFPKAAARKSSNRGSSRYQF